MNVRAKFRCTNHNRSDAGSGYLAEVRLQAVYGNGEDNKSWSAATPSGELKMTITNPAAAQYFAPGKEYFITFDEAPNPPVADKVV